MCEQAQQLLVMNIKGRVKMDGSYKIPLQLNTTVTVSNGIFIVSSIFYFKASSVLRLNTIYS